MTSAANLQIIPAIMMPLPSVLHHPHHYKFTTSNYLYYMAPSFESATLQALKDALKSSIVFTPDSEGYQDSLRRWSDTGIKPAVRSPPVD